MLICLNSRLATSAITFDWQSQQFFPVLLVAVLAVATQQLGEGVFNESDGDVT